MSKRFGPKFNPQQSLAHKKPKLDVSISTSKYTKKVAVAVEIGNNEKQKSSANFVFGKGETSKIIPTPAKKSISNGVKDNNSNTKVEFESQLEINWIDDDEDDDFLIAASQIAEERVKSVQYSFSCTQFNNKANLASSTQKPLVQNRNNNVEKLFDIPISIFDNESFEIDFEPTPNEASEAIERINLEIPQNICNNRNENTSFRNILFEKNNYKRNQNVPNDLISNKSKKDQDTMEVSELVKRLNELESETKNQKNIINDQTEKIQNKEGEVSVLRFDIKQLKSQVDVLKIEKIKEAENMKKNWEDRIEEWKRKYNSTQLELNIKSNEIMKIKANLPESRTLEIKKSYKQFSSLNLLHIEEFIMENNEIEIFLNAFRNLKKEHDTLIDQFAQHELDILYSCLISLQNNTSAKYTSNFIDEIKHSLQRTFNKLFIYFENLRQLEFTKNNSITYETSSKTKSYYYNSIDLIKNQIHRINLNTKKRFQGIQNYIIIFGLLCEKVPKLVEFLNAPILLLLKSNKVNQTPIMIMNHSADVLLHLNSFEYESGIFESYAFLFNRIAKINQVNSENISLLKILLFKHRPSLETLLYITESLLNVAKNSTESLNLLCSYVKGNSCHYNAEKKVLYIQQNTSCVLQVYCIIFELTMTNENGFKDMNLIFLLWEKYLLFIRQCFTNLPNFFFNSNEIANKNCKCFYKLSKTFVNVFYCIISRWNNSIVIIPDLIRLKLCKLGSLLVCNFYHHKSDIIHSMTFLSLKHKLYIICEWLDNCRNFLKLEDGTFDVAVNYVRSSFIFANSFENEKNINLQKGVEIMKSTFKLI